MRHEIIKAALREFGVKELPGAVNNSSRILEYFAEIGHSWVKDDETAWCSAFVNYIAKITGHGYTNKLDARSWLNIGFETKFPQIGDVVVLWRGSKQSWKGHVGFFIREYKGLIYMLGGNQDNQVCIKGYAASRLLGYRILE